MQGMAFQFKNKQSTLRKSPHIFLFMIIMCLLKHQKKPAAS